MQLHACDVPVSSSQRADQCGMSTTLYAIFTAKPDADGDSVLHAEVVLSNLI